MGGIAFILAIAITLTGMTIWYAISSKQKELIPMALTMALAVMNGMIGFVDDYKKLVKKQNEGLKAGQKFALQMLVAIIYVVLLKLVGHIDTAIHIPFTNIYADLGIVYYVFAVILIVGVVNSVNLTDGLDGLASSITLIVAVFFGLVALIGFGGFNASLAMIAAALIGAMIGFLVFNHHPAKVFMGDTGSLFLGGAVTGMAFIIDDPMIILIAGGVYIFETISVMLQVASYKMTKKRIFKCSPIHHHFEACKWSEVKIVHVFSAVTLILCVVAWFGI